MPKVTWIWTEVINNQTHCCSYIAKPSSTTWCQKWPTMASLHLQPPSTFNFRTPDKCPRWQKRFEQFCFVSGLSDEAEEKQVSTLLYCMGEDADDTLTSTHITADERKQYQAVIAKLDRFFQVRRMWSLNRRDLTFRRESLWNSLSPVCTI